MTFPTLTAFYGSLLALFYVGLSGWVVAGRLGANVLHGDGGDQSLSKRIRSHANFIEYVPLALLLIGLYEAQGGHPHLVRTLLIVLLVARLIQPFGMFAPVNSPRQFACRGGGIGLTLLVVLVSAVALLIAVI